MVWSTPGVLVDGPVGMVSGGDGFSIPCTSGPDNGVIWLPGSARGSNCCPASTLLAAPFPAALTKAITTMQDDTFTLPSALMLKTVPRMPAIPLGSLML